MATLYSLARHRIASLPSFLLFGSSVPNLPQISKSQLSPTFVSQLGPGDATLPGDHTSSWQIVACDDGSCQGARTNMICPSDCQSSHSCAQLSSRRKAFFSSQQGSFTALPSSGESRSMPAQCRTACAQVSAFFHLRHFSPSRYSVPSTQKAAAGPWHRLTTTAEGVLGRQPRLCCSKSL